MNCRCHPAVEEDHVLLQVAHANLGELPGPCQATQCPKLIRTLVPKQGSMSLITLSSSSVAGTFNSKTGTTCMTKETVSHPRARVVRKNHFNETMALKELLWQKLLLNEAIFNSLICHSECDLC